ncbi:SagB family peptide dehydrogenase [Ichthyobacterium seriolicida]|uniref:Dehydrogenase SagB n=1 Tax=Ichthyobacterium seriolicida TaxID=242600 RepID=A0A1J1E374_9FLAO|nr:SagB family peptide dehydrogenase [Ichthyobacterium seriolicida]BAV94484.1 dehydrogenase SagB [Ichthyobacterium seriolicida]
MKKKYSLNDLMKESEKYDKSIYSTKMFDLDNSLDYIQSSKISDISIKRDISKGSNTFYTDYVLERASNPYKTYFGKKIKLNDLKRLKNKQKDFIEVLRKRKSHRKYLKKDLSSYEIFSILNYSYGISREENVMGHKWQFRYSPSPGGIYSSDIYLILVNSHFKKGLYHYQPKDNSLELIKEGDFSSFIKDNLGLSPYIDSENKIGGCIIISSNIQRLYIKYNVRAYRFMLLEVGILLQSLSLVSSYIGIGSCILGGFYENKINDFIGLDGDLESVQGVMVIGHIDNEESEN